MFPIANHKSQVICATITTKALLCILISDSRFELGEKLRMKSAPTHSGCIQD